MSHPHKTIHYAAWLAAAALAAHLYAALAPAGSLFNWFHSDDAFYYFKTAQNIAEGYGITFDRLGRTGGFHPLWMAICTPLFALARVDLLLPLRLVVLVEGLLVVGTGLALYRLARRALSAPAAALAAFFFCFYPPIHAAIFQLGLESGLSAFCLALLLWAAARAEEDPSAARLGAAGVCAALAVMARLDNVFVAGMVGVWLALRSQGGRGLVLFDTVWTVLGVLAAFFWRVGFGPAYAPYRAAQYAMLALAPAVRLGAYWLAGRYGGGSRLAQIGAWAGASVGVAVGMLGLRAVGALPAFPRLVLAAEAALALAGLLAAALRPHPAVEPPARRWNLALIARRALIYFAPTLLFLLAYMGFYQVYFGTLSPVSGQIKRWWGTLPNPVYGHPPATGAELLGFGLEGGPWELVVEIARGPFAGLEGAVGWALTAAWVVALAALLGFVLFGYAQRNTPHLNLSALPLPPLAAGAALHLLSYTGTGYLHVRDWYWAAQYLLFALLLAALFDALRAALPSRLARLPLAALAALALCLALAVHIYQNLPYPSGDMAGSLADVRAYYGITELEARTPPGARIGSTGGGVIAYLIRDRTIVNLDGLMNTAAYFRALQAGRAADYLDRLGLEYVFSGEYVITSSDPYFQLAPRLEKLADFGGATLFRWVK